MKFSIVIPALNEEAALPRLLERLSGLNGDFEVIVADGGSTDATREIAESSGATFVRSPRGRGQQQHTGAATATGDVLWFVHADSTPQLDALRAVENALSDQAVAAGNFTLRFEGDFRAARQLTIAYPWFRLLGLCYGDSGIFVRRSVYEALGGFQPFPLFEDVDFVRRVKKKGRFVRLACQLTTSSRRFEKRNIAVVFAHWTFLQLLYWMGVSPVRLAALYAHIR
jgi:rSAM/selenodomain-associated transferase 2